MLVERRSERAGFLMENQIRSDFFIGRVNVGFLYVASSTG
ncbi:hypothetical protein BMD_2984 [Priestia megaterium DSM 319]|uniref:Uncharacterized protein n=1 Tax=Priestia megaterium (strain DSM 319 / IMG 1521) TaxID=592022 RepID=D5DHY6_PRIM3|nr:hypothetical protein BMD_2984 [Priestia megaterium DSM 319]